MRAAIVTVLAASCLHAQAVPDGLSASDWSRIRAAYEAGRHQMFASMAGIRRAVPASSGWLGSTAAGSPCSQTPARGRGTSRPSAGSRTGSAP